MKPVHRSSPSPAGASATEATVPAREPVTRPLDSLAPHPRQAEVFGDPSDTDIAALAADIEKRGLQEPVEITPTNVIVAGHSRVAAARLLGWAEVPCAVRHDLAAQGEGAVFAHFVGSNTARRDLTRLTRVRCVTAVLDAEAGRRVGATDRGRETLKAEVAKEFNMSARNLNRLLAVLRAPREVQDAYDRGEITLAAAARGSQAPGSRAARGAGVRPGTAYRRLVAALRANLPRFEGNPGWLARGDLAADADLLARAAAVFADLAERGRAYADRPAGGEPPPPPVEELLAPLVRGRGRGNVGAS